MKITSNYTIFKGIRVSLAEPLVLLAIDRYLHMDYVNHVDYFWNQHRKLA